MEKLLELAREEIETEINNTGFINDSDRVDRFLDELAGKLSENDPELEENIMDKIKSEIMKDYNLINHSDLSADYEGYYYDKNLNFETMQDFYNYFKLGE